MTSNDDDQPELPIVAETCDEAQRTLRKVMTLLQAAGWSAVTLSISRAIEVAPGDFRAPGATATVFDRDCAPILPLIVEVLRKQADALLANSAVKEVDNGYIQDGSNYASGLTEWPR